LKCWEGFEEEETKAVLETVSDLPVEEYVKRILVSAVCAVTGAECVLETVSDLPVEEHLKRILVSAVCAVTGAESVLETVTCQYRNT